LCVLIIAAVGLPLVERTTQPHARAFRYLDAVSYDVALPSRLAQFRLDLRMISGRLARFFGKRISMMALAGIGRGVLIGCELLMISAVLQVGLVLPMAYYFHRATIVALPANILAVPLTEAILVAVILAVTIGYVSLTLAKVPTLVASVALKATSGCVHWLGGLRIADGRVPTPGLAVLLLSTAALILAMLLVRRRPLLAAAGLAALVASAIWICVVPPHPQLGSGVLEVTAIDVGQGDSILLVSPQGRTLLVDAGGVAHWMHSELDIGEDVVSPYLWSRGIARLDVVAVTHAHADHIGGMGAILANFHPHELWIGVDSSEPELKRLLEEANVLGIPAILHKAGDTFELGGAEVKILAPEPDPSNLVRRPNDESLVMKLTYGATSALLEGDAERQTERQRGGTTPGRSAQGRSPRQCDLYHPGTTGRGASKVCGNFRGCT
jgi:competence protein ComEC